MIAIKDNKVLAQWLVRVDIMRMNMIIIIIVIIDIIIIIIIKQELLL